MSSPYVLPSDTTARLNLIVHEIETGPLATVPPGEMDPPDVPLNIKAVVDDLPEGLDEEDMVGIISLSMLTECATDSYAQVFLDAAKEYDAPWLGRFTERVWVPDEYTHTDPFKLMLMDLGFSETELKASIKETQEKVYVHTCGKTPVELTTFGMIQEFLTDNWYGMIASLFQNKAPEAARMATRVKRRETLHYIWYKDLTAVQVQADPGLLPLVAHAVTSFSMPGGSLVPQYQSRVLSWMKPAGTDFQRNAREMIRQMYEIAGDSKHAGQLLIDIAVASGISIGALSSSRLQGMLDRIGGLGYALLGEAVLECVGLPLPAGVGDRVDDKLIGTVPTPGALYDRLRGKVRGAIAGRIDLSSVTGASF